MSHFAAATSPTRHGPASFLVYQVEHLGCIESISSWASHPAVPCKCVHPWNGEHRYQSSDKVHPAASAGKSLRTYIFFTETRNYP